MVVRLFPKPTFDEFIQACTPLAIIDDLEARMRERINELLEDILKFAPVSETLDGLADFLTGSSDCLGIVLALSNFSQERFLRLLSAERFAKGDYKPEWSIDAVYSKLKKDVRFARRIAQLFISGREDPLLKQYIAPFYLDRLALPPNWSSLLRDTGFMESIVRRKLEGEYSNEKGKAIEKIIRNRLEKLEEIYGITFASGQVELVGKQVDFALPSLDDPYVLIMSSYMETTSSSQTSRVNEQRAMFASLRSNPVKRILVNFVDGAGWLARRSDLEKMYKDCDYIINLRTLDSIEGIVCSHLPDHLFDKNPKPRIME